MEFEDDYDGPAIYEDRDERHQRFRRRLLVGVMTFAISIVVIVVVSIVAAGRNSSASTTDRQFEFKLGNLDGDASQIGTFVVRTRAEWAPLGVGRFHVSFVSLYATINSAISVLTHVLSLLVDLRI